MQTIVSIKRCLEEESNAILEASKKLDNISAEKALEYLDNCASNKGKIIITGVGKSGIVARKIAATFSSIGLTSIYLNPLDALHGDLGIVNENDVCMLLSNSGNTPELLELILHLKNRDISCIGLIGNPNSHLAKCCDVNLQSGVDKEVCPLNLAPTASTAVAMALGDALAIAWMEKRKISSHDFAINHPAGNLGRKLTLRVKNVMIPIQKMHLISPNTSLPEIISVITRDGIGSGIVEDPKRNGYMLGIITDGDLRRSLERTNQNQWSTLKAKSILTAEPITIKESQFAQKALDYMENNKKNKPVTVLPVVDNQDKVVGLLRLHDLLQLGLK